MARQNSIKQVSSDPSARLSKEAPLPLTHTLNPSSLLKWEKNGGGNPTALIEGNNIEVKWCYSLDWNLIRLQFANLQIWLEIIIAIALRWKFSDFYGTFILYGGG